MSIYSQSSFCPRLRSGSVRFEFWKTLKYETNYFCRTLFIRNFMQIFVFISNFMLKVKPLNNDKLLAMHDMH